MARKKAEREAVKAAKEAEKAANRAAKEAEKAAKQASKEAAMQKTVSTGKQTRAGSKRKAPEGETAVPAKGRGANSIALYILTSVVPASGAMRMMQERTGSGYSASASDGSMKTVLIMRCRALMVVCALCVDYIFFLYIGLE